MAKRGRINPREVADAEAVRIRIDAALKLIRPQAGLIEPVRTILEYELLVDWDARSDFDQHRVPLKVLKGRARRLASALKVVARIAPTMPPDPELFGLDGEDWRLVEPHFRRWMQRAEDIGKMKGEKSGGANADKQRWAARLAVRLMTFSDDQKAAFDTRPKKGRLLRLAETIFGAMTPTLAKYVREEVARQRQHIVIERTLGEIMKTGARRPKRLNRSKRGRK